MSLLTIKFVLCEQWLQNHTQFQARVSSVQQNFAAIWSSQKHILMSLPNKKGITKLNRRYVDSSCCGKFLWLNLFLIAVLISWHRLLSWPPAIVPEAPVDDGMSSLRCACFLPRRLSLCLKSSILFSELKIISNARAVIGTALLLIESWAYTEIKGFKRSIVHFSRLTAPLFQNCSDWSRVRFTKS